MDNDHPQQARELDLAATAMAKAEGEAIRVAAHGGDASAEGQVWMDALQRFRAALDAVTDWTDSTDQT